ncbi:MAG: metallophosphoesterase family protein [Candidatus Latescibacteria bacterium]|nr:metallophosphoesterase family protein [Candidatus Latescibacterota bacterium]
MWETSEEASSKVMYWETQRVHSGLNGRFETVQESESTVEDDTLCTIHAVTLTGLQPDTTYHYRVSSTTRQGETVESEEYPLKTAVEEHTPFSFAVTSETGGYGDDAINRRLFPQIRRSRPEFLLMVGDAVARGSVYDDWERYFFGPARELLTSTPFYLCLGNHEENASWFYRFVAYPEPKNYYAFSYGNAHFIGLDSTAVIEYQGSIPHLIERDGGFAPGSPQYEFLVRELRSSQTVWKIVFFHYPPYVSADYQVDEMRALCPILEEYGVDVVFNSHTIVYERSHPIRGGTVDRKSGIIYVVAGGSGAMPQWFHHKRAWHTAHAVAVPHFVQVTIAGETLELRAIDDEGRLFDLMTLNR